MNELPGIKQIRLTVKSWMEMIAKWLFKVTKGRLTANFVTWFSVLFHIPIAVLIANGEFLWAAPLLIIFGLMDSIDGALARLSGTASPAGMVLDAFSDRLKETFMHGGVAYFLAQSDQPLLAVLPLLTLGFSLATNFLKAKAEVAYVILHDKNIDWHTLNKKFSDGALSFEIRTAVFILGVLIGGPVALSVMEVVLMVGIWQTPKDMREIIKAVH